MKKLLLFIFILNNSSVEAQNNLTWKYFKHYTNDQKSIINNHWDQFFQDEIYQKLDSTIQLFPLKLDSYGSIYPEKEVLKYLLRSDFENKLMKGINLYKYSFFDLFARNPNGLSEGIKVIINPKSKAVYNGLLKKYGGTKDYNSNVDSFYNLWDSLNYSNFLELLNQKIKSEQIKHIFFFVHGFNVPYSLANIQAIEIYKLMRDTFKLNMNEILFVPIYWPSSASKEHIFTDFEHFSTKDKIRLSNGINFTNYSNRAYYAAISLRKIINGIIESDTNLKISVFSHSLGGIVATSCVINTFSKLQTDFYNDILAIKTGTISQSNNTKFKEEESVNFDLVDQLLKTTIPEKRINIFLSAAAIPGKNTFIDIEPIAKNKTFFVGINKNDTMLTKNAVRIGKIKVPGINASNHSATTLGCDFEGEVEKTKTVIGETVFRTEIVSTKQDHDILNYIQQKDYKDFFNAFLKLP